MFLFLLLLLLAALAFLIKYLNRDFYLLAGCKRFKTIDGSKLETKVHTTIGKTIFGNNFDLIGATPQRTFQYVRQMSKKYNKEPFSLNFVVTPIYSVATAEDAEEILQSQALITKSHMYNTFKPLLGNGLLISTDELWQKRRKLLTPAFHFNILQTFIEVFREESQKFVKALDEKLDDIVILDDVIPDFTLNTICETAMGVKLDQIVGSTEYRKAIHDLEPIFVRRICNPITFFMPLIFGLTKDYREQCRLLNITNSFSKRIIEQKRKQFLSKTYIKTTNDNDGAYGKKQRYAMLDTLLDAETKGLIDDEGICDEVNTFMFEGYDTTSACLKFALVNLAIHKEIQEKCLEEIENLGDLNDLTVFDFNKLEYLECVIKETLRLYPSVPVYARRLSKETVVNGVILPLSAEIHIHAFDIMRDEKHFPNPNKFDPERFKPENTVNRHPFAFIPFSAGPRNCVGQKFAMLEIKVLLVAILKRFILQPITNLDEVTFEGRLVLNTIENLKVKFVKRM